MSDRDLRALEKKAKADPAARARLRLELARREKFERRVDVVPCFGTRGSGDGRGNHGAELHFTLCGPGGALSIQIMTAWHLNPGEEARRIEPRHSTIATYFIHSPSERPGFTASGSCCYLGGAKCWADSGSFAGDYFLAILIREGSEGLWKAFEDRYVEEFEGP